jgi:dihydrofolate reductase
MSERDTPEIVLVVAVADNGVIGRDGALPWRLKSDMAHFRALTLGKPVIMGRRTFLSLRKPLADRTNIVVTRDKSFSLAGALVAHDIDTAERLARDDARRRGVGEIMVIGGAEIYAQMMPRAHRVELTRVHLEPAGDTLFTGLDPAIWHETDRREAKAGPGDDADFSIVTYKRGGEARTAS